ncbi:uncharacterized protein LOC126409690 [Nymphaea colorata]|nr:uncharacterized protein LOC126409690 [Nymphaea colorata]
MCVRSLASNETVMGGTLPPKVMSARAGEGEFKGQVVSVKIISKVKIGEERGQGQPDMWFGREPGTTPIRHLMFKYASVVKNAVSFRACDQLIPAPSDVNK